MKGFALIEILLAVILLGIVSGLIFGTLINLNKSFLNSKLISQLYRIMQNEIERIKVMNYENIGIQGGFPPGNLPAEKIVSVNNVNFRLKFFVRNIDDPRDGTVTSTPRDSAPADYKLIEIEGECLNCFYKFNKQSLTTIIAPKALEVSTNNGSLFVKVIDAYGMPVANADIKVTFISSSPFVVNDKSSVDGVLPLVDVPPGLNAYAVTTTKDGYSVDQTYSPNDITNPILPHQTVASNQLTELTLQIDRLSNTNFYFSDKLCGTSSANLPFRLRGDKLIARNPDVIKTDIVTTTDNFGYKNLNLEWDSYKFDLGTSNYIIRGANFDWLNKIAINPGGNYVFKSGLADNLPNNLIIKVVDQNQNPLNKATVTLTQNSITMINFTGGDYIFNNNWLNNFSAISSGIDINASGKITLKNLGNGYSTATEWLISNTIDFGTTSVNYHIFMWDGTMPPGTVIKYQIAANNDNATWNFIGPDGSENSYFYDSMFVMPNTFNSQRYFRYKIFLQTTDPNVAPLVNEIKIYFDSLCLLDGYALFQNLANGTYNLQVEKSGYQIYNQNIDVDSNYKIINVILYP